MSYQRVLIAFLAALCLLTGPRLSPASAQTSGDQTGVPAAAVYLVKLRDGSRLIGTLRDETPDAVTVRTELGETRIPRSMIREMTRIDAKDLREGEYWYPDPNQSRSLVFPTASTLPKKKIFYENYYLLFNSLHFGVSDRVMLSLGIVPVPEVTILTFGPKVRVYQNPARTVEAAVGFHLYTGYGDGESVTLVVPYGVLSLGNPGRGRLNLGAGAIAIKNESAYMLNLSGDVRVARGVKLMAELFVFSDGHERNTLPIYGLRFFSEKLSFDVGFLNVSGEREITALGTPLASLVVRF